MIRRLPILPTLVVAAAIAVLIALGVWQLHRATWKQGLLARYAAAETMPPISWPTVPLADAQLPLFRHATGLCLRPVAKRAMAGENLGGRARLRPHRRLRDRRRRAGDQRRARLVEGPQREVHLARRPGQRDHRARPPQPHPAGRGQRAAGASAERAAKRRQRQRGLAHPASRLCGDLVRARAGGAGHLRLAMRKRLREGAAK